MDRVGRGDGDRDVGGNAFERQQDELASSFSERIAAADAELRRTLGAFVAEAEAERSALADRLAELARRVDEIQRSPRV